MNTREMQDEIIRLKKENDVCILAHAYQSHAIWEVADYVGDSYGLSVQASKTKNSTVVMCGVRFMAETCKMLSPEKKVILSDPMAGCPMADQYSRDDILKLRDKYPGYAVVCYINTTAETKSVCDAAVTSSSAVDIIRKMPEKNILFVPDPHLGKWVADQVPEKNIVTAGGGCPTHAAMRKEAVEKARSLHPDAELLVHPECSAEVTEAADFVGSTTEIMDHAKKSSSKEFIIGTEASIVEHLQYMCPEKRFYPLSVMCVCHNMKMTTLPEVLGCVNGTAGEEIVMSGELIAQARKPIDRMIELGSR
jgi:quinolinate synthase